MRPETTTVLQNILPSGMSPLEQLDHLTKIAVMTFIALRQTQGDEFTKGFLMAAVVDITEGFPMPVISPDSQVELTGFDTRVTH